MPCIVEIDYVDYAFKKDSDAAKLITLMAGAVRLKHKDFAGREVHWPDERQCKVSTRVVIPNQLFAEEPTQAPSNMRLLKEAK